MTGVLIREKRGRFEAQRHTEEKAKSRWKQRLDLRSYKPRRAKSDQQPQREAWNRFPSVPRRKQPCQ